jgi:hypothetical protein
MKDELEIWSIPRAAFVELSSGVMCSIRLDKTANRTVFCFSLNEKVASAIREYDQGGLIPAREFSSRVGNIRSRVSALRCADSESTSENGQRLVRAKS